MLICFAHRHRHLAAAAHKDQSRLRKEVFVDGMGWGVPHGSDWEQDNYDRDGVHYIVQYMADGRLGGCCRMIPTGQGSMVEDLWPQWVDTEVPRTDEVWELSRFAIDPGLSLEEQSVVFSELNVGGLEYNRRRGARKIMIFTELALVQAGLDGYGVKFSKLGPVRSMDGKDYVVVLSEDMTQEMIEENRKLARIDSILITEPMATNPQMPAAHAGPSEFERRVA